MQYIALEKIRNDQSKKHDKINNGKIVDMEIVTWTNRQVKMGALMNEIPETASYLRCRKQLPFQVENENGEKFECDFELEGTKPAQATLKLIEELSECRTNLNDMYNDDINVEGTTLKVIRMVRN